MLIKSVGLSLFLVAVGLQTSSSGYGPEIGKKAPDFVLEDSKGNTYRLSDFQGKKTVVLEFFRSGSW
jgi:peroxiredoxin